MITKTRAAAAALIIMLFTAACGVSLNQGKLAIPISLDEKAVTRLIDGVQGIIVAASPIQPSATINHVAFIEPDSIRVDGTYQTSNDTFIQGSMTIAFAVVDDQPRVAVTSLDVPGFEAAAGTMESVNRALEEALQREVGAVQEAAVFKSITVENNALNIIVEVPLKKNQ